MIFGFEEIIHVQTDDRSAHVPADMAWIQRSGGRADPHARPRLWQEKSLKMHQADEQRQGWGRSK